MGVKVSLVEFSTVGIDVPATAVGAGVGRRNNSDCGKGIMGANVGGDTGAISSDARSHSRN